MSGRSQSRFFSSGSCYPRAILVPRIQGDWGVGIRGRRKRWEASAFAERRPPESRSWRSLSRYQEIDPEPVTEQSNTKVEFNVGQTVQIKKRTETTN
ncbi:hypothetical protein chiPu_0000748 [Chiloscyllium punctatum]|uniref:Uncharacterized protein n=1 Tax=Chiloscyllium punctatum TaxID=137246 RepID=A0A401RW66_CHIPU|nr:hypothetical protein [Chiloscyllium punctatum]